MDRPYRGPAFGDAKIMGSIYLGDEVIKNASEFAAEFYARQAESDFLEPIESFSLPQWVPRSLLSAFGNCKVSSILETVATCGCDQHTDAITGETLCLVLHNDGLTFRQGLVSHVPAPGNWFIFDDRVLHGVEESEGSTTFLCVTTGVLR